MNARLRRYATGLPLLVLALTLAAEIGGLRHYQLAGRRADVRLHRAERELDKIRQQQPGPTAASASALATDIDEARRTFVAMGNALAAGAQKPVEAAPNPSADLFFAIGGLVETIGGRARELNIRLAPEALGLGFSAYGQEGPEPARGESVRQQLESVGRLLDALLAARPEAILSLQRETPLTGSERQALHAPARRGEHPVPPVNKAPRGGADYFAIDPRWSVVAAGTVDATAFRFVFTGTTNVLRAFIGGVSADKGDLVRSIEVEPAVVTTTDAGRPAQGDPSASVVLRENAPARPGAAPLVSRTSQFTVVLQHIEIVPPQRGDAGKSGT